MKRKALHRSKVLGMMICGTKFMEQVLELGIDVNGQNLLRIGQVSMDGGEKS